MADGTLSYGHRGRAYRHAVYSTKIFKKAVRELAEAERSTFPPGITIHDLRHAYASWLLAAGESVVTAAERLGHDNATMVIKVYGHLLPDGEDRTRKAIDEAWSAPSGADPAAQERPG